MRTLFLFFVALSFLGTKAQYTPIDTATQASIIEDTPSTHFAFGRRTPYTLGRSPWSNPMGYGFLHKGFNAQVSLFGTMGFGKRAPKGVGFGKDLSLSYLHEFSPRLSLAVGAYGSHFSWGNFSTTDIGVTAMLAYRATDRLTLYAYGTKTLTPHHNLSPTPWLYDPVMPLSGDRFGIAADYKFSEKFHLQLNVEVQRAEHPVFYNGFIQSGLQPYPPLY